MKLQKTTLRLALLGFALTLCVFASQGRATAATCKDGDTRFIPNGSCCVVSGRLYGEEKGQSCLFGVWTDNGAFECEGFCPPPD